MPLINNSYRCPAYCSEITTQEWLIPNVPITIFPTSDKQQFADLTLFHCQKCGHYSQIFVNNARLDYI
jgi:hypothetical protein